MDSSNLNLHLQFLLLIWTSFIPLVHSQHHVDAFFFFFFFKKSNALDLAPHSLLLRKLDDFGLSCAYITWFHSYLTYRLSPCLLSWHTLEMV